VFSGPWGVLGVGLWCRQVWAEERGRALVGRCAVVLGLFGVRWVGCGAWRVAPFDGLPLLDGVRPWLCATVLPVYASWLVAWRPSSSCLSCGPVARDLCAAVSVVSRSGSQSSSFAGSMVPPCACVSRASEQGNMLGAVIGSLGHSCLYFGS